MPQSPRETSASLEKAAALELDDPNVFSDFGVALYEVKQPDRALEMLKKASRHLATAARWGSPFSAWH